MNHEWEFYSDSLVCIRRCHHCRLIECNYVGDVDKHYSLIIGKTVQIYEEEPRCADILIIGILK